jgi:hypothetical protein
VTTASGAGSRPSHHRPLSTGAPSIPSGARVIAAASQVVARSTSTSPHHTTQQQLPPPSSSAAATTSSARTTSTPAATVGGGQSLASSPSRSPTSPTGSRDSNMGGMGMSMGSGGSNEMLILVEEAKTVRQGMVDENEFDDSHHHLQHASASHRSTSSTNISGRSTGTASPRRPTSATSGGGGGTSTNASTLAVPGTANGLRASNGAATSIVRPNSDVPLIDQLLTHPNDFAVRPLVGNTLIEKVTAPALRPEVVRSRSLPFKLWAGKELSLLPQVSYLLHAKLALLIFDKWDL